MRTSFKCESVRSCAIIFTVLAMGIAPSQAETLTGAVKQALETNPELGAIRFNRNAIDYELRAARGLRLPTLDLRGEVGRERDSLKSRFIETTDGERTRRELSVIGSQRLFDGWESVYEIARQKNRVESSRWRVADTANAIALRAIQAYFEILRAEQVLAAAQRNQSALRRLQSRVRDRVDAGRGNSAEDTEAGSRFANARALVVEAQERLIDAKALYLAVVGEEPSGLRAASEPKYFPPNLNSAVSIATSEAPSILATDFDTRAAQDAIGSATSRLYPRLNVEVSSRHGKNIESTGDRDLDFRAMLVARWNIFNGGIDRARINEARERAGEAAEISANTRRIVERETRVSWNAMTSARRRIPLLSEQLSLARRTRATYEEQFDFGARRLLDLLDAQSEVFVADAALQTERFVAVFNAYRVLAAMGTLVEAMMLDLPPEATLQPAHSILDGWHARVQRDAAHSYRVPFHDATATK